MNQSNIDLLTDDEKVIQSQKKMLAMARICAGMTLEEMQNAPFTYQSLLEIMQRRDASVGKLRMLLSACNRIKKAAEEFESQDGVEMAIAIDYWLEFIDALEAARHAISASQHDKEQQK